MKHFQDRFCLRFWTFQGRQCIAVDIVGIDFKHSTFSTEKLAITFIAPLRNRQKFIQGDIQTVGKFTSHQGGANPRNLLKGLTRLHQVQRKEITRELWQDIGTQSHSIAMGHIASNSYALN